MNKRRINLSFLFVLTLSTIIVTGVAAKPTTPGSFFIATGTATARTENDGTINDVASILVDLDFTGHHGHGSLMMVDLHLGPEGDYSTFVWEVYDVRSHETNWGKITILKAKPQTRGPGGPHLPLGSLGPITVIIQEGKSLLIAHGRGLNFFGTISS